MITAIVLIETAPSLIPEVAQAVADLPKVSEVYSVTGDTDLIAMVRVSAHEELADVIANHISKVTGVLETRTYIAFQSFSRHDLDAAFGLGFEQAD
ncbi:MAG: Lrp/AsnC ligand binding domain-containing protein [Ruaniaceae bacterium]|nr:Lrp/AsnC ligand binding domain-containing protein [Ruaniaceae bacterium]